MSKKKLVIANWKMYIESPEAAKIFAQALKRRKGFETEAWIASPFVFLPELAKALKGSSIKVGAQTLSAHEGAHTGEISAMMLKSVGAFFVIAGHSERRALGESNSSIHGQLAAAANAALVPVLCVGEQERTADGTHFGFIEEQLTSALRGAQSIASKLVVAYEPVWAIGKSAADAMKPQEVEETIIFIRKVLADVLGREPARKVKVLYGGSVEPANAQKLIAESGIDGFLVGHASAKLEQFVDILKACKE